MTRRELFKSLSIIGVSLTIPVSLKSLTTERKPLIVVGIDWKGCQVADYFSKCGLEAEYVHINRTQSMIETVMTADKIYDIEHPEILYANNNKTLSNEIKSIFNSNNRYIVAVKAGEKETTRFTLAVLNYLNDNDYEYFSFVYLPFGFEGTEKDKRARSVVHAIKNPEMAYINDMRSCTRKYGRMTLIDFNIMLNKKVFEYYLRNVY